MKNDFFYLGTINKPVGLKGQLSCYFDTDEPEKYLKLDAIFIDIAGDKLPYMVEDIQYRGGNIAVVKFKDVDAVEAKSLLKLDLYLPLDLLPPLSGNNFYYHEVIGFKVIDHEKGEIGICQDFIDISKNPIMQIDHQGTEILVPAIDDVFEKIDRDNHTIFIQAPEGLIDVYL